MGDSFKAIDEKEGQKADLLKMVQKYKKSRKIKENIDEINYKRLSHIGQLDRHKRVSVSHSFIRLIDEQMKEMSRILNLNTEHSMC